MIFSLKYQKYNFKIKKPQFIFHYYIKDILVKLGYSYQNPGFGEGGEQENRITMLSVTD
jgi:hypothetical protein